jgi:hypothetical protein
MVRIVLKLLLSTEAFLEKRIIKPFMVNNPIFFCVLHPIENKRIPFFRKLLRQIINFSRVFFNVIKLPGACSERLSQSQDFPVAFDIGFPLKQLQAQSGRFHSRNTNEACCKMSGYKTKRIRRTMQISQKE